MNLVTRYMLYECLLWCSHKDCISNLWPLDFHSLIYYHTNTNDFCVM